MSTLFNKVLKSNFCLVLHVCNTKCFFDCGFACYTNCATYFKSKL